jgi:hypothetical protein
MRCLGETGFSFTVLRKADHVGRAAQGTNSSCPIKQAECRFGSHSRHGCPSEFILCSCSVFLAALRWAKPTQEITAIVCKIYNFRSNSDLEQAQEPNASRLMKKKKKKKKKRKETPWP